jgi:S-adenosylmethionine synthetase
MRTHILKVMSVSHVNPIGKFVIDGADGDCGLIGCKIIADP